MIGKAIFHKCLPVGCQPRSLVILLFNLSTGSDPEIIALIPNCLAPGSCPFLHGHPVNSQIGASPALFLPSPTCSLTPQTILFSSQEDLLPVLVQLQVARHTGSLKIQPHNSLGGVIMLLMPSISIQSFVIK